MEKIGLTYEELTAALKLRGWGFHEQDQSWRADAEDPLSEPSVSIEAMQDLCLLYPTLTKAALELMLSGHSFEISYEERGYERVITLRPQLILVSDDPFIVARPVKLRA